MRPWIPALIVLVACKGVTEPPPEGNDEEVITTVELTIDNGTPFVWEDLELDGNPTVDPVTVSIGSHAVSVRFLNGLEDPPEDITEEVEIEATQHQVFWEVPAGFTWTTGDQDANGLPLGLTGTLEAPDVASGDLTVTLRHMPEEGGEPVKVAGLAEVAATDGIDALPGDTDVRVTFAISVEE
ncbi:MAG: hypothetical protein R3F61_36115 [Myxococcota bacterium]